MNLANVANLRDNVTLKGEFRKMRFSILSVVTIGAALTLSVGSSHADPVTVTLNPLAAGIGSEGAFQANNYTLSDFAIVTINNSANTFTETGTLQFESFKLDNTTISSTVSGLRNGTGGASYGLYITFAGSGTISQVLPGVQIGSFSTISYSLLADAGNTNVVSSSGVLTDNGTPDKVLATGMIAPGGPNQVSLIGGIPSADVLLTLLKTPLGIPFFQLPIDLALQEASFTNTSSVVSISNAGPITSVQINGGGGNGTFSTVNVNEPASLFVLGAGLVGVGLMRNRRAKY